MSHDDDLVQHNFQLQDLDTTDHEYKKTHMQLGVNILKDPRLFKVSSLRLPRILSSRI